jgi:hypothetical protein
MFKRIGFAPAVCVLATVPVCSWQPAAVAAENCITAPTHDPPEGSHWYYHFDQARNQRCWTLGEAGHPLLPRPRATAPEHIGRRDDPALSPAQREALFQEFVRWKTLQRAFDKP